MASAKKKKLSDAIHSLLSGPAPADDYDPEADELERGGWAGAGSEDEDVGLFGMDGKAAAPEGKRAKDKGLHMRADIEVDGEEYAGKAIARRRLRKEKEEDDDEEDEEEEEEEEEEEDEEEKEEEEEGRRTAQQDEDDEARQIEEEQETAMIRMVASSRADGGKRTFARNQRELSDALLEARIKMQRPLQLAARLPRGEVYHALCEGSTSAGEAAACCCEEIVGLVKDLMELRGELWAQYPGLPDRQASPEGSWAKGKWGKKRQREAAVACGDLWAKLTRVNAAAVPFRDSTVDRWNGKVMMSSGGKAFKALNQSILQQTKQVMQDRKRLLRKTRVRRSVYKVVADALHDPASLPAREETEGGTGEELDPEAYDDSDLYQLLLRDLIESGSTQGADALALQNQLRAARRKASKVSKNVDTKASKGRKIRYDVQPKLVNFMFPIPASRPAFAEKLFENLFKA